MYGVKNSILVSTEDVYFLLESVCKENKFLTEKGFEGIDKTQDNYIRVRENWDAEDIATLDFDGTLHPAIKMANIIYIMQNHGNEIRVEYKDVIELWFLNSIEALCIRISGLRCEMLVYRLSGIFYHLKQLGYNQVSLNITVKKDTRTNLTSKLFEGDSEIDYAYWDEIYGGVNAG